MSNGKVMIIRSIVGLIKMILSYKTDFFSRTIYSMLKKMEVGLDLSNCGIKFDLKCETRVDTSKIAK